MQTLDTESIKRIREKFNIPAYTTINGGTESEIKDKDIDLLRECEKQGFIQIRFK